MYRRQMLFNRFIQRALAISIDRQRQKKTRAGKSSLCRNKFDCVRLYRTPVTHGICFERQNNYILQYLFRFFAFISLRSFIIVVYFMRCVIYFSIFFLSFHPFIHTKLKHDRQSCRCQLCHLAGTKNAHTHLLAVDVYNGHIAKRNICDWFWRNSPQPYPYRYCYFAAIHFHDRKNSFWLNLGRPFVHVIVCKCIISIWVDLHRAE